MRDQGKRYKRPLIVSIILSILGETAIFVIWGLLLYPEGSWLSKFFWTIIICGIGMGSTIGAAIVLFVVDRFQGLGAIIATTILSVFILGIGCDFVCYELDKHFQYFGATENPTLFLANGVGMSLIGGLITGVLLFTENGNRLLSKLGV